jgi:hypothetical protein
MQNSLSALTHDDARGAGSNIFPVYQDGVETEIDIFAKREDVLRKIILDRRVLLAKDLAAFF